MTGLERTVQHLLAGSTSAAGLDLRQLSGLLEAFLRRSRLPSLVAGLEEAGMADQVRSWLGPGANGAVSLPKLARVIGEPELAQMGQAAGLTRVQTLNGLAELVPALIDALSTAGPLPDTDEEVRAALRQVSGAVQNR